MRRILIPSTLACSLAMPAAAADAFQWEVQAAYETTTEEDESGDETDTGLMHLRGTYHFRPVERNGHPWSEAAFLEHSMWASVRAQYQTRERDGVFEATGIQYGAAFRYASMESPIAFEIGVITGPLEDEDIDLEADVLEAHGKIGYWFLPNLNAGAFIAIDDEDVEFGAGGGFTVETFTWGLFGKWVQNLANGMAVNLEAELAMASEDDSSDDTDESNIVVTAGADLYFTQQYSVGATLSQATGDDANNEGFEAELRGTAWFTPNVALSAGYGTFIAANEDEGGEDADTIFVELWGRF